MYTFHNYDYLKSTVVIGTNHIDRTYGVDRRSLFVHQFHVQDFVGKFKNQRILADLQLYYYFKLVLIHHPARFCQLFAVVRVMFKYQIRFVDVGNINESFDQNSGIREYFVVCDVGQTDFVHFRIVHKITT